MKRYLIPALSMFFLLSEASVAGVVTWTDWTSSTSGASGSAAGEIGSVDISYTGDVTFAQLGAGRNYWTEGFPAPYSGSTVIDNAPTPSEMIAMSKSGITNTVTFSTTVIDPIMAIVSQGRTATPVTYDFDAAFNVLSEGQGYWGNGHYELLAGDMLKGYELHGAIQFVGSFDSISWTSSPDEYWHGFTFGLGDQTVASVPEPTSLLLLGLGLLGMAGMRRKS